MMFCRPTTTALISSFFFFNDTATTEIYTLSLHDALPISPGLDGFSDAFYMFPNKLGIEEKFLFLIKNIYEKDRKSTRLNSSHANISYAVFCLKKKQCRSRAPEDPHFLRS